MDEESKIVRDSQERVRWPRMEVYVDDEEFGIEGRGKMRKKKRIRIWMNGKIWRMNIAMKG